MIFSTTEMKKNYSAKRKEKNMVGTVGIMPRDRLHINYGYKTSLGESKRMKTLGEYN